MYCDKISKDTMFLGLIDVRLPAVAVYQLQWLSVNFFYGEKQYTVVRLEVNEKRQGLPMD